MCGLAISERAGLGTSNCIFTDTRIREHGCSRTCSASAASPASAWSVAQQHEGCSLQHSASHLRTASYTSRFRPCSFRKAALHQSQRLATQQ